MTPTRKAGLLRIADEWLSPGIVVSLRDARIVALALKEMLEVDEKSVAVEMLTRAQLREKAK